MIASLTSTASTLIGQKLTTLYMTLCSAAIWIALLSWHEPRFEQWLYGAFSVQPGWYSTAQDYLRTHSPATWQTLGTLLILVGLATAAAQGERSMTSKAGSSAVLGLALLIFLNDGIWTAVVLATCSVAAVTVIRRLGENALNLVDVLMALSAALLTGFFYATIKAWDLLTNDAVDDATTSGLLERMQHIQDSLDRLARATERIAPRPQPHGANPPQDPMRIEIVKSSGH